MVGVRRSKQNIYIASLPRSGSTLLGMILNQGKQCAYIGESFYWKKLNPKNQICTCGNLGCKILLKAYKEIKKNKDILRITDVLNKLDGILQKAGNNSGLFQKRYEEEINISCLGLEKEAEIFRKILNKKIIINSSSNIIIGKKLAEKFDWKVIVLIRDPRGVISSIKEAAVRHGIKIKNDIWINYVSDFIQRAWKFRGNKNVLIIKYEELCHAPNNEVKKICKFLGITYNQKILKYRQDKGHIFMANRMRFGKSEIIKEDKGWIKKLSESEKLKIIHDNKIIKGYDRFGYKL